MTVSSLDQADLDRLLQPPNQWPDYHNYQPLDPSQKEIRILKIWHENQGNEIYASVAHESLEDGFEYDALSYYWGPPDEQKPIYVDGQAVLIRKSLYSFLNVLCLHRQELPIWLDSICINQRNVKERNSQVAMMGDIYRSATCVKVWIGETDADLEYSFAYLRNRNRNHQQLRDSEHFSEVQRRVKESMRQVLRRPYWHRLWIIQEIGLAKKAVVMAGERSVDLEELIKFAIDNLGSGTFLHSLSELRKQKGTLEPGELDFQSKGTQGIRLSGFELEEHWLSPETLWGRMSVFGSHSCQDPRDKIFGLISPSTDENPIQVDYGKTLGDLLSQLLYALAQRYGDIVGKNESSSCTLSLAAFYKMLDFARDGVVSSSFRVLDLLEVRQPKDYELYCEIASTRANIYGRLTPRFSISMNFQLCEFRNWDRSSIHRLHVELPVSSPNSRYKPIISNNDTNFYHIKYDRGSRKQICYYLGDREPDPIRCQFSRINLPESFDDVASPYVRSSRVYFDHVMLLIEYDEDGPRVSGIYANSTWWHELTKSGITEEELNFMDSAETLAVLLLEGEVQICSRAMLYEDQSCHEGRVKLRLHYSRLASMLMLMSGALRLTIEILRKALVAWRVMHLQCKLCNCEFNVKENAKTLQLVRKTNMDEIRDTLKGDIRAAERSLSYRISLHRW